jgi:hypothetical protein
MEVEADALAEPVTPTASLSFSNPGSSASGSTSEFFLKQQQQPWGTTTPLLQALTTSPEFFDLTSDSEVSREPLQLA